MSIQIQGKATDLKLAKGIIDNMIANGLAEVRQPIWMPGVTLAVAERIEGKSTFANSIVFSELPKELSKLNNMPLPIKGNGPIVKIVIANAVADWEPDEKLISEAKAAGRKVPRSISKGEQQIRCFS